MPLELRSRKLYLALCGNAALLGLILASMWARRPAAAVAQAAPPAVATAGMSIMPGQLSPQTWGCYLLDADRQTLCVYSYRPGEHELRLDAARDVQYDRSLKQFNTTPPPTEVGRLADRAAAVAPRAAPRE